MTNSVISRIIVATIEPKNKDIIKGSVVERDGKMYYISGKNTICLTEHFANTRSTVSELVENTIRYEGKNFKQDVN